MSNDRAAQFLSLIRRSQRGRHKIYLGYGPGVGKTCLMLQEGHRLLNDGIDVVIGVAESHGREGTARLIQGLPMIAARRIQYHGITIEEMDIDGLLQRKPQVALVDELAHTNVPGSRNEKRYQDVQELLAVGIHVISTVNIQHLESLYDTVERQIGVKVRERVPDSVLAEADQVVNVDLAPDDLQRRLEQGQIYPKDRIPSAMGNFFKSSNLEQLRELTMRELASQIDFRRREARSPIENGAPDQIMVCLSSRGPNTSHLLRFGSRLAGRLNRTWYAVYVQTPREDPISIDASTQRILSDALTLAHQLGATVFTFKGDEVVATILGFAKEYRVGHIVIGKPRRLQRWRRLLGMQTIAERLIRCTAGETIVVVDVPHAAGADPASVAVPAPSFNSIPPGQTAPLPSMAVVALSKIIHPSEILIFPEVVERHVVMRQLIESLGRRHPEIQADQVLSKFEMRERLGSTSINVGVAVPHVRLAGIASPLMALGITHAGILDAGPQRPIRMIFAVLSPLQDHNAHLQLLAALSKLTHEQETCRLLEECTSAEEAFQVIQGLEARS